MKKAVKKECIVVYTSSYGRGQTEPLYPATAREKAHGLLIAGYKGIKIVKVAAPVDWESRLEQAERDTWNLINR